VSQHPDVQAAGWLGLLALAQPSEARGFRGYALFITLKHEVLPAATVV
jgi:hypothetical protein